MLARIIQVSVLVALIVAGSALESLAQSSCSATNTNGDQNCSISCPAGQSAQCSDATGSNPPTCECSGTPDPLKTGRYILENRSRLASPKLSQSKSSPTVVTNIVDVINAKLQTLPNHHLGDNCHNELCGPFCIRQVCVPVMGKLTVVPPLIISVGPDAKLSEPDWNSIPTDVFYEHQTYKNCGSVTQSQTFQHVQTVTEGQQITKTQTVTTGSTQSVQLQGSFKILIANFSATNTLTINTQASFTDTSAESHTESKTLSDTIPVSVPKMTETSVGHSYIQYSVPLVFNGTITVDGQLGPNRDGLNLVSQVISNASDRSFSFSGAVVDSTLIDMTTVVKERHLNKQDCVVR